MSPNPLLTAMGLAPDDRAVLIHTDDIGMCHASLAAYADLSTRGVISAGSVMVPCPWFPATAQFCAEHAGSVDMGVHITLTSEWRSGYRWAPLSTCDPSSGLLDEAGYLPATTEAVQANARPDAVRREIETQVRRALDAGIDVTHIDTHMGTVFHPTFLEGYIQTALSHGLPPFLVRVTPEILQAHGLDAGLTETLTTLVDTLEAQGLPMFDDVRSPDFDGAATHLERVQETLKSLNPGLTYLIIHPSKDTPELRAIMPHGWQARVAEYETFMMDEVRAFTEAQGIQMINWRRLRDLMRSRS